MRSVYKAPVARGAASCDCDCDCDWTQCSVFGQGERCRHSISSRLSTVLLSSVLVGIWLECRGTSAATYVYVLQCLGDVSARVYIVVFCMTEGAGGG